MKTMNELRERQLELKKYAEELLETEGLSGTDKIDCYTVLNYVDYYIPHKGRPAFLNLLFETDEFPRCSLISYEDCVSLLEYMYENEYKCLDEYVDRSIENSEEALKPLMAELTDYFVTNRIHAFVFDF